MRIGFGIKEIDGFRHIPFDSRYLCKTERYSIAGYPCLYLGYSEDVCYLEMGKVDCSCIKLKLKEGKKLSCFDLTLRYFDNDQNVLVKFWPLVAACNLIPFYCVFTKEVYTPSNIGFKEEYIIPQLLTMYIHKKFPKVVDGIRYYTVRNEDLNPFCDKYMNLILFTRYHKQIRFDKDLCDKFYWSDGYDYMP